MIFGYKKGSIRKVGLDLAATRLPSESDESFAAKEATIKAAREQIKLRVKLVGRQEGMRLAGLLTSEDPQRFAEVVKAVVVGLEGLCFLDQSTGENTPSESESVESLVDDLDANCLLEAAAIAAINAQAPSLEQRDFLGSS